MDICDRCDIFTMMPDHKIRHQKDLFSPWVTATGEPAMLDLVAYFNVTDENKATMTQDEPTSCRCTDLYSIFCLKMRFWLNRSVSFPLMLPSGRLSLGSGGVVGWRLGGSRRPLAADCSSPEWSGRSVQRIKCPLCRRVRCLRLQESRVDQWGIVNGLEKNRRFLSYTRGQVGKTRLRRSSSATCPWKREVACRWIRRALVYWACELFARRQTSRTTPLVLL